MAGIRIGNKMCPTAVVAHADDVTIFVTDVAELAIVEEVIKLFEKASEAHLNPQKSKHLRLVVGIHQTQSVEFNTTNRPQY